jgi:hypothetical protein
MLVAFSAAHGSGVYSQSNIEAPYVAFTETITHLRPRPNRCCARMTGSLLEKVVMQEALF